MKKQSKVIIGIVTGILFVVVIVIIAVIVASGSDSKKYARHMESAQRYMDELDYEQAIAEYIVIGSLNMTRMGTVKKIPTIMLMEH